MSNIFNLPRDADGFLDMEEFPDADLDLTDAALLNGALANSEPPDLDDDTWQSLVDRAVDPDAPPVDEALVDGDEPYPDVDDAEDPFGGVEDGTEASVTDEPDDSDLSGEDSTEDFVDDPALDPYSDDTDLPVDDGSMAGTESDDLPPLADDLDGLDASVAHLHDDDI